MIGDQNSISAEMKKQILEGGVAVAREEDIDWGGDK